ncbi:MAG: alkane 1-monooxygenase [Actinobacteria bacterium]|nr:alkane 1-monooxygenase [Actinomycetota bacterium]
MRAEQATSTWRDSKRYLWVLGLTMPLLPFLAVGLHELTGWGVWLWLGPIVILGMVPIIDWIVGLDPANPPDAVIKSLEQDRYYRWLTYLFLPLQYAGFALAFWYIATGDLTLVNKIGLAVTVGFIGGLGINTAHELGHKKESHERWLSKIALAQSCYGHFYIEHNRGHHVRVATPADPASSRVGESFYRFWPRTVFGSLASAWELESRRYSRRGQHPFRIGNDVINALLMTAALWALMVIWLGPAIMPFLLIQAFIAITLLEAVNYLEHYGMLREIVGVPGKERYERVEPRHSWNSNNIATNVLLYHLQRHSDHHAHPTRRYQALRDEKSAPALPTGYASMILLALVPPAWNRVMDPRVLDHFDGDISRANIAPHKRERILRRYPAAPARAETTVAESLPGAVAVLTGGTVVATCPGCGYSYDERRGDPREGFAAGTAFASIPDTWCCPDCGVRDKVDFLVAHVG